MNICRLHNFLTATIALVAISNASCTEKDKTTETATAPANEQTIPKAEVAKTEPTSAQVREVAALDVASARWIDIKDCNYDARARFFAGLKRLEEKVDDQISQLAAKRAAITGAVDMKDWDFALKEMGDARSYLKAVGEELMAASPETWEQQRDTVGHAWARTQEAFDKVKSSTTS